MSENLPKQPQQSEEVDLGQLFKLIGNAFDRFFKFVANIFNGIFKLLILILGHFYKRFVWYVGAIVIGVVVGYFMDKNSEVGYGANMTIETNFGSTRQVYEVINEFQQLANVDRDSLELAKRLNITPKEASHLKGFYIEAVVNENVIARAYSRYYMFLDSLSRMEMTYDRYKESLTIDDFKTHVIGVASTDKFLYSKIEKTFVDNLTKNPYLEDLLETNVSILKKKDLVLKTQVKYTDSLVKEYLRIRKNESEKENISNSGTNIYMASSESQSLIVDESKVLKQKIQYENERRALDSTLVRQSSVVNILSGLPKSGYETSIWYDKKKYSLPLLLFLITVFVFMFKSLGRYLSDYGNK